jgi:type II secretory pathway component GspD/PulD (secretin)
LKHASAVDVGRMIEELMGTGRQDSLRVVANPNTNQLLLKGTAQVQLEIEAILQRLDLPPNDRPPPGPSKKGVSLSGKK